MLLISWAGARSQLPLPPSRSSLLGFRLLRLDLQGGNTRSNMLSVDLDAYTDKVNIDHHYDFPS